MIDYERLGVFYLGKRFDPMENKRLEQPVLYDAKDLLTHAVIVGMTGSGKTGLGIGLLEEALIDNIPVIAIDPKGDLPNLMLGFPELAPGDFREWVAPAEAARRGLSREELAADTAEQWRAGLAQWQQGPERIARLKDTAEFRIYTPGSTAGLPVSILRNFAPPGPEIRADGDLFQERINAAVTALLTLMAVDADPLTSREHILLANIFEKTWAGGGGLDIAGVIKTIQAPPFERIGVLDLEAFYPAKERFQLAMRLNNLLAAPGFEAWLSGEELDIARMLHTPEGKPRCLIFSIAHLPDNQRMFFTARLLSEVTGWMRTQPGTASLRALLYMDEIYGYFPPVQNPPSKTPLLTLLKQARAYGLGVVLSTQNPVDLDYKGLSNAGTWFIGRLQTEKDRERLMAGLTGGIEREQLSKMLEALDRRVFLLHNVHETEPFLFETRWTLSFLAGPVTREQIKRLAQSSPGPPPSELKGDSSGPKAAALTAAPLPPPGVKAYFLPASGSGQGLTYAPAVGGWIEIYYSHQRLGVDIHQTIALATPIEDGPLIVNWENAVSLATGAESLADDGLTDAEYAALPASLGGEKAFQKWQKELLGWSRRNHPLVLYQSKRFKLTSLPGESQGSFRSRLTQSAHEERDLTVEKVRRRYADKFATLQNRLMRAQQTLEKEKEQAKAKKVESVISFGTAILGAFLGRRKAGAASVSRMGTAMKSAGRLQKEQMDVARADESVASVEQRLAELEQRLQSDLEGLNKHFDPAAEPLEEVKVTPRSTDMHLKLFGLVWLPYRRSADGRMLPDWQ